MKLRFIALLICLFSTATAYAQKPGGFFKTSDGVKIHYLEAGKGRPIVLIPGWTMPAWIWQKQIDELSKSYFVVAVDPRSQGESDKPTYGHLPETRARDYKELVDHLSLRQPVLVGWSMACGEVVKYVEQFGTDNIGGLILVDGFLPTTFDEKMFVGLSGWMNQLQEDRRKQADGFVRSIFKKPQPDDYLQRVVDASISVPADTAVVLIYNLLAARDLEGGIAKLNRPTMFVYQPQTQPTADLLKAKLGDRVRLEKFEDAGHALFVDDPERFNHVVDDFVRNLPN